MESVDVTWFKRSMLGKLIGEIGKSGGLVAKLNRDRLPEKTTMLFLPLCRVLVCAIMSKQRRF